MTRIFSDIVNPDDIKMLTRSDPKMQEILNLYGPPPAWSRPPGFVSLVQIILEQQVSLASATAHFNKLQRQLGEISPVNVLKLSDEEFRASHISQQKTRYLRILAEAILNQELALDKLPELEEEYARKELTKLKGIGHWTADIYLMFCLRSKDIFPIGDIAVVNTIKELYAVNTTPEIMAVAAQWAPNRSLAVHFLWHYYLRKRNRRFPF